MSDFDARADAVAVVGDDAHDECAPVEPDRPSLLAPSMFAAGWWIAVLGGLTLVVLAFWHTVPQLGDATLAFWMIAGLLFLFEFFPVIVGSGYDSQGVATSDAFVFATLYLFGPWTAIALISAATLGSEIAKRKASWKVPYNIGNFALSLGSAALIMVAVHAWNGEPVPTLSETVFADVQLTAGTVLPIDADTEERAVYIVSGEVDIAGDRFGAGQLLVLRPGDAISVSAPVDARIALVGGAAMDGPRHIWWNFVSSRKDRIEQAKADWRAGRMKLPDLDNQEFIPLPPDPPRHA